MEGDSLKLELDGSIIRVDSVGDRRCDLTAIVDMGSPVSFVKYSVYLKMIKPLGYFLVASKRKFVNIKCLPLDVVGMVTVDLTSRLLKNKQMSVKLYVIRDQAIASDFILGQEFILQEKLTVIYNYVIMIIWMIIT